MRRVAILSCLLLAASAQPVVAATGTVFAGSFEGTWVSGYHVGYQHDMYPTAQIDFAALSHLFIGRVTPNANGTLTTTFDIDSVTGPQWAQGAATAAHANGVKAVLMVGGAGEYSGWVGASSNANRATFVTNLLNTMDTLGFDGLDLDWEPIADTDKPQFLALAQALRSARPTILLSVPVGWANANFATPDAFYGQIAPYFNQINVMSYDMAGAWDGWYSWHSSALAGEGSHTPSSVSSSVEFYLASGVPRTKLGIGLPFYGTCWGVVTAPGQQGGNVIGSDNTFTYHNIVANGYYSAANAHFDAAAQVPYLGSNSGMGAAGCRFLSYDNEQSIAAKGAYTQRNGLGGTIIWTIGEGYFAELPAGQRNPLLEAVRTAFNPQH